MNSLIVENPKKIIHWIRKKIGGGVGFEDGL